MADIITFQTFNTFQEASEVKEILQKEGIHSSIAKGSQVFDAVIVGGSNAEMYELKMDSTNFSKARTALYNSPNFKIEDIDPAHPLFDMSDDELQNIISKPDEWGPENYNIALFLLRQRGVNISNEVINELQDKRAVALSEKKPMSTYILALGYGAAIIPFITNFLSDDRKEENFLWYFPGLFGLLISWVILQSKITLPNGKRVTAYSDSILIHGLIIFGLNILSWIINFLVFANILF